MYCTSNNNYQTGLTCFPFLYCNYNHTKLAPAEFICSQSLFIVIHRHSSSFIVIQCHSSYHPSLTIRFLQQLIVVYCLLIADFHDPCKSYFQKLPSPVDICNNEDHLKSLKQINYLNCGFFPRSCIRYYVYKLLYSARTMRSLQVQLIAR